MFYTCIVKLSNLKFMNNIKKIIPFLVCIILINNIYAQSSFKATYQFIEKFSYGGEKDFIYGDEDHTLYYKNGISQFNYISKKKL